VEGVKDLLARVSQLKDDLPQVARLRLNPLLAAPGATTVLKAEVYIANAAVRTDSARRALLTPLPQGRTHPHAASRTASRSGARYRTRWFLSSACRECHGPATWRSPDLESLRTR